MDEVKRPATSRRSPIAVAGTRAFLKRPRAARAADAFRGGHGEDRGGLHRLPAGGGTLAPLTRLAPGEQAHRPVSFLPDGRLLYLAERPSAQSCVTEACSDSFAAHVVSPDTGESSLVLERIGGLAYTETGDGQSVLLFLRGNELWAQPVDTRSLRLSGNPVRQTTGVMAVSSSTNGVVVTRSGRPSGTWTAADRRVTAMAATPLPENCT